MSLGMASVGNIRKVIAPTSPFFFLRGTDPTLHSSRYVDLWHGLLHTEE